MEKKDNIISIIIVIMIIAIIAGILYLIFRPSKTITVSFDTNSEQKINSVEVKKGESIKLPNIEKKNYKFAGWYINDIKIDDNYKFDDDTTISAKWDTFTYKINFDTDGGNTMNSIDVECGLIVKPDEPTKVGYKFVEWQDKDGKKVDRNSELACVDQTIKAIWKIDETAIKYTITFDSSGGSNIASQTVYANGKVIKPTNPTRQGYTFVEWQLEGRAYNFDSIVSSNITLTAIWQKGSASNIKKYTVAFFDTDTIVMHQKTYDFQTIYAGGYATKPADPVRSGKVFSHWRTWQGEIFDFSKPVTSNVVLIAVWKKQ